MTSQINYNNIDGTYPIAGQDNSSQGFRDNFTNIKDNLRVSYNEISDLQSKVLLKSPLNNGTFNNDMEGNVITNATTQGFRDLVYALGNVSGPVIIDFNVGSYQSLTLSGSTVLTFANFTGTTPNYARMKLQITATDPAYTLTLPTEVTINTGTIAGLDSGTNVLTFDGAGTYVFEFGTTNGGTSFNIIDLNRNSNTVYGGNLVIANTFDSNITTGITMTVSNIGGSLISNITATNFFGNIISTSNSAAYSGNITANNFIANSGIVGTLKTALQPNITLLGTLSSLSVTGAGNIGTLTVNGEFDTCGKITETGIQVVQATNGANVTVYGNVSTCIINPTTSTIASYTVYMPTGPVNGQKLALTFANTITALTMSGNGLFLNGALTTGNANVGGQWIYYALTNTWFKI
jgi:hypothetical protein